MAEKTLSDGLRDGLENRIRAWTREVTSDDLRYVIPAHALCRIADALEKLVPASFEMPVRPISEPPRCPACMGSGISTTGFCSCQTGKDLEAQQKRMGHLEA